MNSVNNNYLKAWDLKNKIVEDTENKFSCNFLLKIFYYLHKLLSWIFSEIDKPLDFNEIVQWYCSLCSFYE